jgi:hypothetical protein
MNALVPRPKSAAALLAVLLAVAFFAVGFAVREGIPETWDEQFDLDIGRHYADAWEKTGFDGVRARFIELQRNYGPFFDTLAVRVGRLAERSGIARGPVTGPHLAVLAVSSATLLLVFALGAAARSKAAGLGAALALAMMPQWVAHSQNNLKDTPLAAFFLLSLLLFHEAVRRRSLALWAVAGTAAGLTYAIKLHALFLAVVVPLWLLALPRERRGSWGRLGTGLALAGGAAVAAILWAWPYYRHDPVARLLETLRIFGNHEYNELVFYLGRHYPAHDVPWHFAFVMLAVNTPLLHLALAAAGLALLLRASRRSRDDASLLALLLLWVLVPILAQIGSGTAKLDGVRHYLFALPALALLAGIALAEGAEALRRRFPSRPALVPAFAIASTLAFVPIVVEMVRLHPYEVVFFNRLAGGTAGARARFELDYWGLSLKAAAEWIDANAPTGSRVWLTAPAEHFFHIDRTRFRFVNAPASRPHYKVNLIRGLTRDRDPEDDYLRPRRTPVFAVCVAGADLLQVFEYPENRTLPPGFVLPPLPTGPAPGPPGLVVDEFANARFEGEPSATRDADGFRIVCGASPFEGRPVSLRFRAQLGVETPGTYYFEVFSDDEAALFLNGREVLRNATLATSMERIGLEAGAYDLKLEWANDVGGACLAVRWAREDPAALEDLAPGPLRRP